MESSQKQSTIQDTITTGAEKAQEASPVGFLDSARKNLSGPAMGEGPFARLQQTKWRKLDSWHLSGLLGNRLSGAPTPSNSLQQSSNHAATVVGHHLSDPPGGLALSGSGCTLQGTSGTAPCAGSEEVPRFLDVVRVSPPSRRPSPRSNGRQDGPPNA